MSDPVRDKAAEERILAFIREACWAFGARESTGLKIAAEFAQAFENGEISVSASRKESRQDG